VVAIIVSKVSSSKSNSDATPAKITPQYFYSRKKNFISPSEKEFFKMLVEVAGDRYYIFPQIHLSALFNNETNGRYHNLAFQIINRRSVDFVLCDKQTLEPVYAVELDDPTHNRPARVKRDADVDQLFAQHNFPLIRFRDYRSLDLDDIAKRFYEAHNSVQQ
jgi:very-short-patch-repair endonuclease